MSVVTLSFFHLDREDRLFLGLVLIFLIAGLALAGPVANGAPRKQRTAQASPSAWPMCTADVPVMVFPVFFGGENASAAGRFGVAGCTYPFGTPARVYFESVFSDGPVPGLPSRDAPRVIYGRTVDGHMHGSFPVPAVGAVVSNAFKIVAEIPGAAFRYPFAWVREYCQSVCDSDSVGGPGVPFTYSGWTDGPAGAFTLFVDTTVPYSHLRLHFVDRQTGGDVAGLPSRTRPWTYQVGENSNFKISFTLPSSLALDTTIYNVNTVLSVEEPGLRAVWPLWFHRYVV